MGHFVTGCVLHYVYNNFGIKRKQETAPGWIPTWEVGAFLTNFGIKRNRTIADTGKLFQAGFLTWETGAFFHYSNFGIKRNNKTAPGWISYLRNGCARHYTAGTSVQIIIPPNFLFSRLIVIPPKFLFSRVSHPDFLSARFLRCWFGCERGQKGF